MPDAKSFSLFYQSKRNTDRNKTKQAYNIEKGFKDFFISYAKSINKRYNRTGALFQYKFKRKEIEDKSYYTWLAYYIHSNPIKAGLVKEFGDWKYSSYSSLISNKPTILLREELLRWFGNREEFILFHELNLKSLATDTGFIP